MSKLILFNSVKERLITQVPTFKKSKFPGKHVAIFNNQFDNEHRETAFPYPNCFIQFTDLPWQHKTRGVQQAEVILTLHVGFASFKDKFEETGIFELLVEIHQALQGFDGQFFTGLSRGGEQQDIEHDQVIVWQVNYITNLTDIQAQDTRTLVNAEIDELDVQADLDIDNEKIRTGDGDA